MCSGTDWKASKYALLGAHEEGIPTQFSIPRPWEGCGLYTQARGLSKTECCRQKVGFRREARRAAPEAHLLTGRENLLDVCSKHQEGLLGGLHFLVQSSSVCVVFMGSR